MRLQGIRIWAVRYSASFYLLATTNDCLRPLPHDYEAYRRSAVRHLAWYLQGR